MSYLTLPAINMADIQKGTISLWFRFSRDSVDAARAQAFDSAAPEILKGVIPLVTFGRHVMKNIYEPYAVTFRFTNQVGVELTASFPNAALKGETLCEPSHIGIRCDGDEPRLKMLFQTETRADVVGLSTQVVGVTWENPPLPAVTFTYATMSVADISYVNVAQPESFLIEPKFAVEPDRWHHLLVSFDLSGSVDVVAVGTPDLSGWNEQSINEATIKSYCKLWFAFDDENKNGKDNMGDGWVAADPNGIVTETAPDAAFVYNTSLPPADVPAVGVPASTEYHWAASPIPMNGGAIGLPASAEYVDNIYHCEMAEFQFFGDVAIDTDALENRRAFIDEDGKPVKPTGEPSAAEELLEKKPDILLHGARKWKKGYNTGTTGVFVNEDGSLEQLPEGQFIPVAAIEKYKPEPALDA